MSWVKGFRERDYTHRLSLKLDIDENEWLKNLPMNGKDKVHMRHENNPFEKKTSCSP